MIPQTSLRQVPFLTLGTYVSNCLGQGLYEQTDFSSVISKLRALAVSLWLSNKIWSVLANTYSWKLALSNLLHLGKMIYVYLVLY